MAKKEPNNWIKFVQEYHSNHKNLSYKEAIAAARPKYYKSLGKPVPKKTTTTKSSKKQKGGNPLAVVGAVADAAGAVQGTIQKGIEGIDNQLERGFEKKKMTGAYDRAAAHNARAVLDRRMRKAQKYAKKYGMDFNEALALLEKSGAGK